MSIISLCPNRKLFYSVLLIASAALAGCTTTAPRDLCTPAEQKQLKKHLLSTQSLLDQKEASLSRLRATATQDRCMGSLFTPAVKSAQCAKLLTKTDKLKTETQTLRERVHELNMALAGRPSPSRHVKSCRASWIVTPKKPRSKTVLIPQQKSKTITRPKAKIASAIALPVYEIPAPIKAEKVDYIPASTVQTSNTPAYVAPVTSAPPVERPYTENTKVRVVGSDFFPDQSALAGQPAPAHAPAP